jgi:tRNA 2-thiouridine synthesizing protein A
MDTEELRQLTVDKTIDCRGTACPGPLLEAKRKISTIPPAGTIEVLSSDEGTADDIPAWAKKVGHDFLGTIAESGMWRIFVRRGK